MTGVVDFSTFFSELTSNLPFALTVLITLAVIMVNGWTDAANAIATCIGTRSLSPGPAIVLAAIFNFLGVFVMTLFNATVAETIYKMVDFGTDPHTALIALFAGLIAIVIWAVSAWFFGINTSESHALIAGISGAAIALQWMWPEGDGYKADGASYTIDVAQAGKYSLRVSCSSGGENAVLRLSLDGSLLTDTA